MRKAGKIILGVATGVVIVTGIGCLLNYLEERRYLDDNDFDDDFEDDEYEDDFFDEDFDDDDDEVDVLKEAETVRY